MHQWPVGQGTRRHWLSAHWTRNQWGVRGALAVAMAGMATLHTRHAVLRCRTYLLLGWAPSRRVHTGTAPRAKLPSLYFASAIGLLPPQTQLRELIPLAISVTSRWLRHYKVSRSLDVPGRPARPSSVATAGRAAARPPRDVLRPHPPPTQLGAVIWRLVSPDLTHHSLTNR